LIDQKKEPKKNRPRVTNCRKFRVMAARIATSKSLINFLLLRYRQFLLFAITLNFLTAIYHRRVLSISNFKLQMERNEISCWASQQPHPPTPSPEKQERGRIDGNVI